jgi:hypothetical protein
LTNTSSPVIVLKDKYDNVCYNQEEGSVHEKILQQVILAKQLEGQLLFRKVFVKSKDGSRDSKELTEKSNMV